MGKSKKTINKRPSTRKKIVKHQKRVAKNVEVIKKIKENV